MARDSKLNPRYLCYWLTAALLFGVSLVFAWGSTPIGLALWSVVALPLAISTRGILVDRERRAPPWAVRIAAIVWSFLVVLAVGLVVADAALAPFEEVLQWAAVMFVVLMIAWGVWASTHAEVERDRFRA
jgi:hypothetical protein